MTLKHSQQSPVTFNKKQMLLTETSFYSHDGSLSHKILLLAQESSLWSGCDSQSQTSLCLVFRQRLLLFEGTQLLEEGPTIQGSLKKLQQYKGKWKFSKPEIHKCLILQKMQAFNLWWGGFLSAHSDEYPSTSASAWNHEDDLCVGG